MFKFDINAVKFKKINFEDLRFLKCEYTLLAFYLLNRVRLQKTSIIINVCLDFFLQLVTHCRLTTLLNKNSVQLALAKYTRKHLLEMFDALHQKDEFQHIFIYDFLERTIPRGV